MTNQDLAHRVEELIKEVNATHRYSMSRIYGLYNEVFDRNEKAQSCASCLIRKVKELQTWLDSTKQQEPTPIVEKTEFVDEGLEEKTKIAEEIKPKITTRKKRKNGTTEA